MYSQIGNATEPEKARFKTSPNKIKASRIRENLILTSFQFNTVLVLSTKMDATKFTNPQKL